MEFNINPDYIQFKNDILKDIREFDKKLTEQMKLKHNSYDSILSDVKERLEKTEKDSKASILSIIEIKSKIEQFNELLTYKQNIDNSLYSQEMRIKIALDEVYRLKSKYDKLINDHLMVPGIIGGSYKFKNLKDYINFNSMEISRLKSWQEDQKRIVAEIKKKLDNIPVTMVNMVDSAVKQSNEYNEQLHKESITKLEERLEELNKRILEIRAEYSNSMTIYEEKQNKLNEQIKNFANIKSDILASIDEKLKKVKEKEKDKEKIKRIIRDIDVLKKKKDKRDEQIEINAESIKEIKNRIKRMSYIDNVSRERKARMSFSNNNVLTFLKNKNGIQTITEDSHPLSAKKKKDETDMNKTSDSENSDNNSESKNKNDINKMASNNRLSTENDITPNNKIKVSHFNPINSRNLSSSEKKNELNNIESNESMVRKYLVHNSDSDSSSSSSSSSQSISKSEIKPNKNKNISNNKIPKLYEDAKSIIDKMANSEESRKETKRMKSREEIEINILKSKINKAKDLFKVIDNKNLKILNKTVNLKEHEINSDINNSLKAYNINSNLNSNFKSNYNLFKNYDYNYEKLDKNLINDIINNSGNNENIENIGNKNKNKNVINLNVRNKGTSIDINNLNNNVINQNLYHNINSINNINKKQNNEIKLFSNIEKYKNNSNFNTHKKLNLDFINSSITNSQNKNNYKINESTFYNYYTSRTDSRKHPDYQISDADIKIKNVDLYKKTKKNINESDHKQHYSFSGKKIKHKLKEKPEEISPVDYLYKLYFVKKNKDVILNNLKKITPAFGRTAYTFYDMKKNNELGISPY